MNQQLPRHGSVAEQTAAHAGAPGSPVERGCPAALSRAARAEVVDVLAAGVCALLLSGRVGQTGMPATPAKPVNQPRVH